ncbi:hypothetical protein AGMMS49959_15540 [Planctomycetales bacterium]|nr:hypothetical protein AGMMS49959_15540 [Planctomycetales bacterium]
MSYHWHNLLGMESAVRELRGSFAENRLNHAYLLVGAAGSGKDTLARTLAARFLCHSPADNDACGRCVSCQMFAENNHPDFLALPRDTRYLTVAQFVERDSPTENIDHQPVLTLVNLKPALGHGRVVVIADAERMRDEAANAFLKTLEEPPPESLLILTAAAPKLLPNTIVSRCRRVLVTPLPPPVISAELARRAPEAPAAARTLAAELSGGSLGEALRLATGAVFADWQKLQTLWREFTPAAAARWAEEIIGGFTKEMDGDAKRKFLADWLNMGALQIRQNLRRGQLSGWAASVGLTALWTAGERLNANVRPELVALTAALNCFAALKEQLTINN